MESVDNKGGGVQKDTCKVCREGMLSKMETNEKFIAAVEDVATKRADAHATDIKELTRVSIQLASTTEKVADGQALLIKSIDGQEKRIKSIEDREAAREAAEKAKAEKREQWYKTDIGKFVVKAAIIGFFLILVVALGRGGLESLLEILKAVPTK